MMPRYYVEVKEKGRQGVYGFDIEAITATQAKDNAIYDAVYWMPDLKKENLKVTKCIERYN